MAKRGRPPKDPAALLSARIDFHALPGEKEQFEQAADVTGMKLSAWIRTRLLSVAQKDIKNASKKRKAGDSNPSA